MFAERVTLFATVAHGAGSPRRLAVVSERTDGEPTFPCAACLQVALQLGGSDLEVIASDLDRQRATACVGDLLPAGPRTAPPHKAGRHKVGPPGDG